MKQEGASLINSMITFSFLMLLFISFAQDPVQKFVDTIARDYEKEGRAKVCGDILAKKEVYKAILIEMGKSGCIYGTKGTNAVFIKSMYKGKKLKKKLKELEEEFKEGTMTYDRVSDACEAIISNHVESNGMGFLLTMDMEEAMDCGSL